MIADSKNFAFSRATQLGVLNFSFRIISTHKSFSTKQNLFMYKPILIDWNLERGHPLKLERYRED